MTTGEVNNVRAYLSGLHPKALENLYRKILKAGNGLNKPDSYYLCKRCLANIA